mmetsp:Transcript_12990/g.27467  ORF Transcript_12990/g.27467 Transcript_12990/m.27467 type:complete len:238 (-) Transcript_12990:327-1040(-)
MATRSSTVLSSYGAKAHEDNFRALNLDEYPGPPGQISTSSAFTSPAASRPPRAAAWVGVTLTTVSHLPIGVGKNCVGKPSTHGSPRNLTNIPGAIQIGTQPLASIAAMTSDFEKNSAISRASRGFKLSPNLSLVIPQLQHARELRRTWISSGSMSTSTRLITACTRPTYPFSRKSCIKSLIRATTWLNGTPEAMHTTTIKPADEPARGVDSVISPCNVSSSATPMWYGSSNAAGEKE